ncbi:MAG: hypothetical protein UR39_C0003G0075 [Candidatus Woesebacteria bacterium GW2011_GWA1_33_30]|uniref:Uncharacterized protein n=1 Tax=Candidatus Woesebacteria bacterium GW2011_GWA2_33_28 TaxID=1618561 RepID=A0A0F9ZTQ5_9BACT|nr:MAG: hypothetical protein UR38_C0003G0078 [Candidatus Woesebacteria bacterium GW2011_GWA2_33_28]KKP48540.1 MAG: hypothetical protein UR39_C0003G0075 [Candidatus Woesebacteria bacterium GW2011_GWA1_33_30]KKP49679.1 MAG: hypothetical protein UR40_C0004G0078 [Microgenomates group bacterium GW2011_GWC1_33_32]KKP52296.1 MAG: hypothetical protein UR44_C0003G0078 [Candidatus Woesebacteria bacterium GW2011_GWB1_33_38]KKP58127.1 MAG: hypothetical protein UR48_C0007G0017 [Microgenomates group bacteriu
MNDQPNKIKDALLGQYQREEISFDEHQKQLAPLEKPLLKDLAKMRNRNTKEGWF